MAKFVEFIGEPIQDKPVTELVGVGPKLGAKLKTAGYSKIIHLLGRYLVFKKIDSLSINWMIYDLDISNLLQSIDKKIVRRSPSQSAP